MHLASKELLQPYLRSATQNANEPYKGLVWSFCPTREELCGAGTVEIAVILAVLQFNDRAKAVAKVLEEMGSFIRFYNGGRMCVRRETEEERSNEGQEERKEGLRRAGSGPGRNNI